jgi:hypothetical protein
VRGCGGVAALVGLLAPGGSAFEHEWAAAALGHLCIDWWGCLCPAALLLCTRVSLSRS